MASADNLEQAVLSVRHRLGTEAGMQLSDEAHSLVVRGVDLWSQLTPFLPRSQRVPGTNEQWANYVSLSHLQSVTDIAVVRWSQLRDVVAGKDGTSRDQIADLVRVLNDLGLQVVDALREAYKALPPEFDDDDTEHRRLTLIRLREAMQTEQDRMAISRAAAEVQEVRDTTRVNAGEIATGDLAQHFEKYRKSERTQAEVVRAVAGALIVITVVALGYLITGDRSAVEILQRAWFTVPLFAVAAYLAAESARHRKAAQWAATMRVQLLTVDLYTKPMDPAEAAAIRMLLAERAFGDVPMLAAGADQKEEAAMPVSLQAVLERLLVELRSKPDKSS